MNPTLTGGWTSCNGEVLPPGYTCQQLQANLAQQQIDYSRNAILGYGLAAAILLLAPGGWKVLAFPVAAFGYLGSHTISL